MARKRIFYYIFPYYLLIILLTLCASAWYATLLLKDFYFRHVQEEIETRAKIIDQDIAAIMNSGKTSELQKYCVGFSGLSNSRITIVAPDGKVIADSLEDPAKMENHSDRLEIAEALKGRTGRSVRYSPTLHQNMMYVAMPLYAAKEKSEILRVAVSVSLIDTTLSEIYMKIIIAGIIIAILAGLISVAVSRRISSPILELEKVAANFAKGNFKRKLAITDIDEIDELAGSMNYMADELNRRMREILEQRNRQNAILSSMMEGVIAVDAEGRIISMNRSATALLKAPDVYEGRFFQEVVRNAALQNFIDAVLSEKQTVEKELSYFDSEQHHLYVRGTVLHDPDGGCIGALLVMNDITRLKKLENLRSEFVANVSHEIKTPLTAIKASVETLLENNSEKKEETDQLLKIIGRHTERLTSIVDDILSLSKLEDDKQKDAGKFIETLVEDIIESALADCREKAEQKQISFTVNSNKGIVGAMNSSLIEQALVNLIDNAIKYSEPNSPVEIESCRESGNIMISVKDHGCGISEKHLPRVFERFYRVDRARSRKLGGTGLGLSIVKHIANVHGGKVEVESSVGKGSKFTIILPGIK
ncbi:MAG: ATP-binding protein [Lentisphaerae bacterium]|nr:ATP-binding protein [Lentisphaerota bacterium]